MPLEAKEVRQGKVLVLGGSGFLGRHVLNKLAQEQVVSIYNHDHRSADLTCFHETELLFASVKPDFVINLAGFTGNVQFNIDRCHDILCQNANMAFNVLEACRRHKVKKVVSTLASCAYPADHEVMNENDFTLGLPHPSVMGHGMAKRILFECSRRTSLLSKTTAVCVIPPTLYGPGQPFDEHRTKFANALIYRIWRSSLVQQAKISIWGTGWPRREILHVADCASWLWRVLLDYDETSLPLNMPSGVEPSIQEFVTKVCEVIGYQPELVFDHSKPDGQFRKRLCDKRWKILFPDLVSTTVATGIEDTVRYYANRRGD